LTHPHTFAWYILVGRFNETVRATWSAPAGAAKKGEKAPAAKKEAEKKVEEKPADDDELDLFGDDSEEDSDVSLIFNRTELISLYRPSKLPLPPPRPRLPMDLRRLSLPSH
jgi:hypothetical protein